LIASKKATRPKDGAPEPLATEGGPALSGVWSVGAAVAKFEFHSLQQVTPPALDANAILGSEQQGRAAFLNETQKTPTSFGTKRGSLTCSHRPCHHLDVVFALAELFSKLNAHIQITFIKKAHI
jgi:hypothetical protein